MRIILSALLIAVGSSAFAAGDVKHPHQHDWAFDGAFGTFDKPAIQRGLQVYKEVCSSCHGVKRVPFRRLVEVGFSEAEVKSLAASYTVMDGPNDDGEMYERPGRASDKIPSPYPNELAARAVNNGAYPLDLSLITKARHDGPNYVYSLLTGYEDAPAYLCKKVVDGACVSFHRISPQDAKAKQEEMKAAAEADAAVAAEKLAAKKADAKEGDKADEAAEEAKKEVKKGDLFLCASIVENVEEIDGKTVKSESCTEMGKTLHYNPYFAGNQIAMVAPLHTEGQVEYQDETKATVEQMSHDVVNFLQWAAEPEMENRKRMGIRVMIFLGFFTVLFYIAKKRIWNDVPH